MSELVFVYGTLRGGASNAWRMDRGRLVAAGVVRGRLFRVTWYPALVLDPAAGAVRGEVYDVSPELLAELDRFEGDEYRRLRALVTLAGGTEVEAWLWEWRLPVEGLAEVAGGNWLG